MRRYATHDTARVRSTVHRRSLSIPDALANTRGYAYVVVVVVALVVVVVRSARASRTHHGLFIHASRPDVRARVREHT